MPHPSCHTFKEFIFQMLCLKITTRKEQGIEKDNSCPGKPLFRKNHSFPLGQWYSNGGGVATSPLCIKIPWSLRGVHTLASGPGNLFKFETCIIFPAPDMVRCCGAPAKNFGHPCFKGWEKGRGQ